MLTFGFSISCGTAIEDLDVALDGSCSCILSFGYRCWYRTLCSDVVNFNDCRARKSDFYVNVTMLIFKLTENLITKDRKKNVEKKSREMAFANRNIL